MGDSKNVLKDKVKGMGPLKLILLILLLAGTACSFVFQQYIFAEDSVFNKGVTDYEVVNDLLALVPKLISAIRLITIALLILTVVLAVLSRAFRRNRREITVIRLVSNIIKTVTIVIIVIGVLAIWGIDTTALITGAGVLTLVVGLGMQSLIGDVVAGLFIVFENEFNVGDIVTIGDFRGTVVEIGIRTTKLEALGNIKIINNSDIRGVLNQTVNPSTAVSLIDIEYGDSLPRVEKIIADKLPGLQVEGALSEVVYNGVASLGASGVTLHFSTTCQEGDIFAVQRRLNGALKQMFDENGIGIPFPQLVLHTAETDKPAAKKTAAKPAAKKTDKTTKK